MDYMELLKLAESRLIARYDNVINDLKIRIASGSTGGEIGALVGEYLEGLKKENHPAYLLLKPEVDLYLSQFEFLE